VKAQEWQQLRDLGLTELRDRERDLAEQLFKLRLQKSLGQIDNAVKVRHTRRQIARIKTLIRQKQGAGQTAAPAAPRDRVAVPPTTER
jgi:large subunit ribosomal protein L29